MARIDDMTERRIKESASIVDVIGDFYDLKKKGINYMCLCPFHEDRHLGSFIVSPKHNSFHCFACGAHGHPVDFLMMHEHLTYPDALRWLARKYNIEVEGSENFNPRPAQPRKAAAQLPMLTLPVSYVTAKMNTSNDTLCNWMRSLNWDNLQRERLEKMLRNYGVGHARQGHTIFWQIDENAQVRTGKLMLYKPDGHRDKDTKGNFHWVHNMLNQAGKIDLEKCDYSTTFFGMHLLSICPQAQINLVESEKTALLCATYWGDMQHNIWMATGGMTFLQRDRLKPIIEQGRRVVLFPDKDGVEKWREQCRLIDYPKMSVSDYYLREWWTPDCGDKADLGDIIVNALSHPRPKAPTPAPAVEPVAAPLPSSDEVRLKDMINKYPAIGELIERFDLKLEKR